MGGALGKHKREVRTAPVSAELIRDAQAILNLVDANQDGVCFAGCPDQGTAEA